MTLKLVHTLPRYTLTFQTQTYTHKQSPPEVQSFSTCNVYLCAQEQNAPGLHKESDARRTIYNVCMFMYIHVDMYIYICMYVCIQSYISSWMLEYRHITGFSAYNRKEISTAGAHDGWQFGHVWVIKGKCAHIYLCVYDFKNNTCKVTHSRRLRKNFFANTVRVNVLHNCTFSTFARGINSLNFHMVRNSMKITPTLVTET